jgi:hypothetical protein
MLSATMIGCGAAGVFNPVMSGLVLQESAAARAGLAAGINDCLPADRHRGRGGALGALVPAGSAFGEDPAAYVHGLHRALLVVAAVAAVAAVRAAAAAVLVRQER